VIFTGAEHLSLLMSLVGSTGALITSEDQAVLESLSAKLGNRIFKPLRNTMIFIDEKYINMPFF